MMVIYNTLKVFTQKTIQVRHCGNTNHFFERKLVETVVLTCEIDK